MGNGSYVVGVAMAFVAQVWEDVRGLIVEE